MNIIKHLNSNQLSKSGMITLAVFSQLFSSLCAYENREMHYYDPGIPAQEEANNYYYLEESEGWTSVNPFAAEEPIKSHPPTPASETPFLSEAATPVSYPFEDTAKYTTTEELNSYNEPKKAINPAKAESEIHFQFKNSDQTIATSDSSQRFQFKNELKPPLQVKDETIAQLTETPAPSAIDINSNVTAPVQPVSITNSPLPTIITPDSSTPSEAERAALNSKLPSNEISVNFNNVAMIEYIRFLSRVSKKNFIFDDQDLQFNVTIVSEEPISDTNFMSVLLQELKIRDLSLIEQGNNLIIHRNPKVRAPARIIGADEEMSANNYSSELVTRVFRLNTLDPLKASEIIRPLLSDDALIEVLRDTNNIIITDLVTNVEKIHQLINALDAPNSGVMIGQFVVRNAFVDSLVELSTKIISPIAQGNPFVLVPHAASNSIYIVSNRFIVEKALAILQNLDQNEGKTKILSLDSLNNADQDLYIVPAGFTVDAEGYLLDANGKRVKGNLPGMAGFGSDGEGFIRAIKETLPTTHRISRNGQDLLFAPPGYRINADGYLVDSNGKLVKSGSPGTEGYEEDNGKLRARNGTAFPALISQGKAPTIEPTLPSGQIESSGKSSAIYNENLSQGNISSSSRWSPDYPVGHIERTLFSIYRLKYRRGDQIENALRKIALSLHQSGNSNVDLLSAINSVQWIEASNSIVLAGTAEALDRLRELITEIDTPLRQVFIEMLVLATSIEDSLQYGVQINQLALGGGDVFAQGFNGNIGAQLASVIDYTTNPPSIGDLGGILGNLGYTASVVGTHITHMGTRFSSIAAMVKALHQNSKTRIILNPKIVTEDNTTATIFVGTTDRYKTQSITNEIGNLVTNNFQFIDVGTTLQVTPLIGNNNVITLTISQETSNGNDSANFTSGGSNATATTDVNLVPVINTSRTQTRVHIPNGFFIILSGMIQDVESRVENRVPCLGGIPILGGACKQKGNEDRKQNLMIFIRPLIVDTESELEDITRRQQDVFREKCKLRRAWNYEIDEALDQFNIKSTDMDENGYNCR